MAIELSEFKGNKTISLIRENDEEGRYPFTFGLGKAKLIIENFDDIKKFVEDNAKEE